MRRAGLLSDEDVRALEQVAAVGDILGYQLDHDGRVVDADVNERVIAIPPDALRTIETVILVSGGLEKTAVIRAALRGGYANVLVTDEATAAAIVAAERTERTPAGAVADPAAPGPTMELAGRAGWK
jgi:DNA-binding transcriptional regulator LsrR (DeoR family)